MEEFATRFVAVESSQGFEYIFQEPEFTPKTIQDKETYECDLAFIFDAFNNAWVGKDNYSLVQDAAKPNKNGQKIYKDAQSYFLGAAFEYSIIM